MSIVSVYTVSHDTRYLEECYQSLLDQTMLEWEWIVVLNGQAKDDILPRTMDDRVRVVRSEQTDIGALKAEAVSFCETDLFVELDHDDRLTPTALDVVTAVNPDRTSLLYSDWSHLTPAGDPLDRALWGPETGWLHYRDHEGVLTVRAREATPIHLSRIWWSPNHLKAIPHWSYRASGGYRPGILDDQSLMSRLYLIAPFRHIPERLYEQRVGHALSSSAGALNEAIQQETILMGDAYLPELVKAWQARQ